MVERGRGLLAWSATAVAAAVIESALAVHNLGAAWGVSDKDSRFHAAGSVELAAAFLFLTAGGIFFGSWVRPGRRAWKPALAAVTCVAAVAGLVVGAVLATQAAGICACDGA